MKMSPHLHRVIIGRTREVRGPDALERAAVAVCILVAIVAALIYGLHQVHMVEATEAIAMVAGPTEYNLIEYRAVHGDWPPRTDTRVFGEIVQQGLYVKKITLEQGGALTATLTFEALAYHPDFILNTPEKRKTSGYLSFRPAILGASGYESVMFLCGYAMPPAGAAEPQARNRTTLAANDVPPTCRRDR
jgi:hypothetical protein